MPRKKTVVKQPTLTLHYSVQNGGDGSAYPMFMESAELAEWDQDHMSEGWGESCTGQIELMSDSPITANVEVTTAIKYFVDNYAESIVTGKAIESDDDGDDGDDDYDDDHGGGDERDEFIRRFFPTGLPKFEVREENSRPINGYTTNDIFVDGVKVGYVVMQVKDSGKLAEERLNSFGK